MNNAISYAGAVYRRDSDGEWIDIILFGGKMKKLLFAFIITLSLFGLLSCNLSSNTNPSSSKLPAVKIPTSNNLSWESVIYRANSPFFKEMKTQDFGQQTYTDKNADASITLEILNSTYTLYYKESAILGTSDKKVHSYKVKEDNDTLNTGIWIDQKNGEVVKYFRIPYEEKLLTENDYINFAKQLLPQKYDLSLFEYDCSTHRYISSDKFFESTVDEGFLLPEKNSNKEIIINEYTFTFRKKINKMKTEGIIQATFNVRQNVFSLSFFDIDYTETDISFVFDKIESLDSSVENVIRENAPSHIILGKIIFNERSIFIKNREVYIKSTVDVEFIPLSSANSNSTEQDFYLNTVEVVSRLVPSE